MSWSSLSVWSIDFGALGGRSRCLSGQQGSWRAGVHQSVWDPLHLHPHGCQRGAGSKNSEHPGEILSSRIPTWANITAASPSTQLSSHVHLLPFTMLINTLCLRAVATRWTTSCWAPPSLSCCLWPPAPVTPLSVTAVQLWRSTRWRFPAASCSLSSSRWGSVVQDSVLNREDGGMEATVLYSWKFYGRQNFPETFEHNTRYSGSHSNPIETRSKYIMINHNEKGTLIFVKSFWKLPNCFLFRSVLFKEKKCWLHNFLSK